MRTWFLGAALVAALAVTGCSSGGDTPRPAPPCASVAAGDSHTVAVEIDGTLWTWGHNHHDELGNGRDVDSAIPIRIGTGFISAAAAFGHILALKADGTLWGWGLSADGQAGNGRRGVLVESPVVVGTGFKLVAADGSHTVALKEDGTLWA